MGDKDLETPMLKMDIAGRLDYHKEPLSLLSIVGDTANLSSIYRPLAPDAASDGVLLSKQPFMALPTHEDKLSASWSSDSLKRIYEDGLFKLVSNSAGDSHFGFKFLQPPTQNDQPHMALGSQRKDKLEDRLGIAFNLQLKF